MLRNNHAIQIIKLNKVRVLKHKLVKNRSAHHLFLWWRGIEFFQAILTASHLAIAGISHLDGDDQDCVVVCVQVATLDYLSASPIQDPCLLFI